MKVASLPSRTLRGPVASTLIAVLWPLSNSASVDVRGVPFSSVGVRAGVG